MSNWREQLSEESESKAIMAWLNEYYHVPALLFVIGFAFWNRIRNWDSFVVDGEVILSANDPWYHMRSTEYAVRNFPQTMPFDPWTNFPFGTFTPQFGTLFDQVIAFVALLVGLGNPSQFTTRFVFMISPAFWVVLICIPAYFIGRRVGGRFGGLITVGFVAFAPDRLLLQGIAGNVQHHTGEALFMALGVLGVMVALRAAEEDKPVYELLAAREFDALRRPIGWSMLAGVAIGMYMWVWPPGVWIYGILGAFFVLHMSIEHVRGRSPEHPAFVGVIALTTASITQLSTIRELGIAASARSPLQVGLGLAVAGGIVFLAWLSREVDDRDLSRRTYPAIVAGSIVAAVGFVALALPGLFEFFLGEVDQVLGFITRPGEAAGTVGEAQPADRNDFVSWYKLANYTAILGGAILVVRQLFGDESRGEELLLVVWSAFLVAATLTQIRFGYYLTIPMGALNAALVGFVMSLMGSETETESYEFNVETYQVLVVVAVILLLFVPMFGLFGVFEDEDRADTVMEVADVRSNPGDVLGWRNSLDWMNENTPAEGQYANPDGEQMDLWGQYTHTDDYDYPDGSYGVMSWWDYGHWITGQAERIPNANPFQQNAGTAAEFLLAQDEQEAEDVLSRLEDSENAQTRYVMVDWRMVETESSRPISGKFFAPSAFTDKYEGSDFQSRIGDFTERGGFQTRAIRHKQAYYQSMVVRLYHYHGSSQSPRTPLGIPVLEWTGTEREFEESDSTYVTPPQDGTPLRFVDSIAEAQEIVEDNPSAQIGGIGAYPEERVPALENYRLVQMSDVNALARSEASLEANQNGLQYPLRQSTRRTTGTTGLGIELARQITGNQNLTQAEFSQLLQGQNQMANRILGAGERFLFPNTPAWTKVFERVEGATIEGEGGPENSSVTLQVPMVPENGEQFTYTQSVDTDENGEFTATVPYATEGYDNWGPEEGYTNVSVRANGSYSIRSGFSQGENGTLISYTGSANVTEAQVIGEDDSPVQVSLERNEQTLGTSSEGGEDGDSESGGDGEAGGEDGDGGGDDSAGRLDGPSRYSAQATVLGERRP